MPIVLDQPVSIDKHQPLDKLWFRSQFLYAESDPRRSRFFWGVGVGAVCCRRGPMRLERLGLTGMR